MTDSAQYAAAVRLGTAIGFLAESLVPEISLTGISVVGVSGLSRSELRLVWSRSSTSRDIARFVRHVAERTGS